MLAVETHTGHAFLVGSRRGSDRFPGYIKTPSAASFSACTGPGCSEGPVQAHPHDPCLALAIELLDRNFLSQAVQVLVSRGATRVTRDSKSMCQVMGSAVFERERPKDEVRSGAQLRCR